MHSKFTTMDYAENILGTIGNTPMDKMNKLVEELDCLVLAKYDALGSIAHAKMLGQIGLLTAEETTSLVTALEEIIKEVVIEKPVEKIVEVEVEKVVPELVAVPIFLPSDADPDIEMERFSKHYASLKERIDTALEPSKTKKASS